METEYNAAEAERIIESAFPVEPAFTMAEEAGMYWMESSDRYQRAAEYHKRLSRQLCALTWALLGIVGFLVVRAVGE